MRLIGEQSETNTETRRCDYVTYRGGMRGAIMAICINDPRTHAARRMIAAGLQRSRRLSQSTIRIRYVRIVPTRPEIIVLPSRF